MGKIAILIFVPFGQSDSNQRCKIGTGSNQKLSLKLNLFTGICYPVGIHKEKICIRTPWKSITSYTFCQFRPSQSSERKTETMIFPLEIFENKKETEVLQKTGTRYSRNSFLLVPIAFFSSRYEWKTNVWQRVHWKGFYKKTIVIATLVGKSKVVTAENEIESR